MPTLWSRITFRPAGPSLARNGMAVSEILGRLESEGGWTGLVGTVGLEPAEVVAALAADALGDDAATGPPLLQAQPRRPALLHVLREPALASGGVRGDRGSRLALSAGLLQVHDFWDASHESAQAADDLGERATSLYWHAIAHRREPDPGNAAYWFRRVGRHPVFSQLEAGARTLIEAESTALPPRLAQTWDPSILIDLTSRARPGTDLERATRRVQRLEMLLVLEASSEALGLGIL
jgi:hypothetical protein